MSASLYYIMKHPTIGVLIDNGFYCNNKIYKTLVTEIYYCEFISSDVQLLDISFRSRFNFQIFVIAIFWANTFAISTQPFIQSIFVKCYRHLWYNENDVSIIYSVINKWQWRCKCFCTLNFYKRALNREPNEAFYKFTQLQVLSLKTKLCLLLLFSDMMLINYIDKKRTQRQSRIKWLRFFQL